MRRKPMNPENQPGPLNGRLSLSVAELCAASSVGKSTIYDEIRAGKLIARKIKGRTVVLTHDAQSWLAARPVMGATA
jgi:hypothetical protein